MSARCLQRYGGRFPQISLWRFNLQPTSYLSSVARWRVMKSESCTGKEEQRPTSPQTSSSSAERWVVESFCLCFVASYIRGRYGISQDVDQILLRFNLIFSEMCRRWCSWMKAAPCGRSCVLQLKEPCCSIRKWSRNNDTTISWKHREMDDSMQTNTQRETFQLSSVIYLSLTLSSLGPILVLKLCKILYIFIICTLYSKNMFN